MKKKIQLLFWVVLFIVACALVYFVSTNIVYAKKYEVKNPVATFEIENYGNIVIELYPEYAPNTVTNFINLINKGYYNGKNFYGKDIDAIYACKNSEGQYEEPKMNLVDSSIEAGSDNDKEYQIDGEFVANGFEQNTLRHEKWSISLLREEYASSLGLSKQSHNSGTAQFQIMLEGNRNLNGLYAVFGKVTEGFDIVEKIFAIEEKASDEENSSSSSGITELATPAVIKNTSVETYGIDYGVPEVHEAFDYTAYLEDYWNFKSSNN